MARRQSPSGLVERTDADPASPFHALSRRTTTSKDPSRVITDAARVRTLQRQIHQTLGALASFRSLDGGSTDPNAMYEVILQFWREVKLAFPDAWGRSEERRVGKECVSTCRSRWSPYH